MLIGVKYIKPSETIDIPLINISSIVINQDIYNPQLSGTITLHDRDSWERLMPTYGDILQLTIKKPLIPLTKDQTERLDAKYITLNFTVYKSSQPSLDMSKKPFRTIIIHFTAGAIIHAYTNQMSYPFKQKTYKQITQHLLDPIQLKYKFHDNTTQKITYTSPLWSAIHTLTDISDHAMADNNRGGYLFFQDLDGSLQFVTIPSLLEGKIGIYTDTKYYSVSQDKLIEENLSFTSSNLNFNKIGNMQFTRTPNYIKMADRGFYSSIVSYFDLETNEIKTINKNIKDTKNFGKKLSTYLNIPTDMFGEFTNNNVFYFPTKEFKDQYLNSWVNTKLSRMLMGMYEFTVSVPGNIDRKLGTLVKVNVPAQMTSTRDNEEYSTPDEVFTGTYLIRGITHLFTAKSYAQTLNLVTDGINSDKYSNNIKEW